MEGLEPSRLSALPPQGSVLCQFHHIRIFLVAETGLEPVCLKLDRGF